jgi:hypothetical protein
MSQLNRLHQSDMANGNLIDAGHLNAEFNQLVSESNSQDTRTTSLESGNATIAGNKTFSGAVDVTGTFNLTSAADAASAGRVSYFGNVFKVNENSVLKPLIAPTSFIKGGVISNNGSDANNDLDITAVECWDETLTYFIKTSGTLVKRSDATWVAGTNQGAFDTGSKAADDNMHIWAIANPATGVTDILFSDNASPTMPSGYTYKRLLHILKLDGSANIRAHIHEGNTILYKSPIADFTTSAQSTTPIEYGLTVPAGYVLQPLGTINIGHGTAASVLIYGPAQTGGTPDVSSGDFYGTTFAGNFPVPAYLRTDTSRRITVDSSASSTIVRWRTHGYTWHGREIL